MRRDSPVNIIRAAQARAGFYRQQKRLCQMVQIPEATFWYKMSKGDFTVSEVRRLDMVLHFTEEEIVKLVRG